MWNSLYYISPFLYHFTNKKTHEISVSTKQLCFYSLLYLSLTCYNYVKFNNLHICTPFSENLEKEIKNEKNLLLNFCKVVSDESKRPRDKYDEDFVIGSFKKLDFD